MLPILQKLAMCLRSSSRWRWNASASLVAGETPDAVMPQPFHAQVMVGIEESVGGGAVGGGAANVGRMS
jgi:hypothetical protein